MGGAIFTAVAIIAVLLFIRKSDVLREKSDALQKMRDERRLFDEERKHLEKQKITERLMIEQRKFLENVESRKLAATVKQKIGDEVKKRP